MGYVTAGVIVKTCCGLNPAAVVALVTKWQRLLGLEHWDISVGVVESGDGIAANESGNCEIDSHRRSARILFNVDKHQDEPRFEIIDTVIHELLHLHFWWVSSDKRLENELLEQAFYPICKVLRAHHR